MMFDCSSSSSSGRCVEYRISGEPFNVPRWLLLTVLLTGLLFWLGLHRQDHGLLTSLLLMLTATLLLKMQYKVREETLLVVASLGVQLSVRFASGRRSTFFIPRCRLQDVIIWESISMQRVVTYLALLLRSGNTDSDGRWLGSGNTGDDGRWLASFSRADRLIVPLFTHTWPRLPALRAMYKGIQSVLARS